MARTRTLARLCGYRMTMELPIGRLLAQFMSKFSARLCADSAPLLGPGCHFGRPSECRAVLHFSLEEIEAQRRLAICNLAGYTVYVFA
mgnify:FL=1